MHPRRAPLLLATLAALVALVGAGCGGGGAESEGALPPTELTSFASAAKASAQSTSARFSLALEQTLPGADEAIGLAAGGAFDSENERAQIDLDLSSLAQLLGGLGAAVGGGAGTGLSTDPDDWRLRAVVDAGVVYLHFPLLSDHLPDGKSWVKGSLEQLADQAGAGLDQFGSFAQSDPRDVFEYLDAVSGGIETVGTDELRGVQTTHYRATVDVAKALELVPAAQRGGITDLDQILAQTGLSQIPIDVWLDAEQRVHKLALDLELTAPGSDQKAHTSMTVELWDYGVPIDVELPPADDVADASSLEPGP